MTATGEAPQGGAKKVKKAESVDVERAMLIMAVPPRDAYYINKKYAGQSHTIVKWSGILKALGVDHNKVN